jgi:protein kinase A
VRLAKNKKTGEYFAMKILKKADIIKLKQVDHVISENTILADIDHAFLVRLIYVINQMQVGLKGFS